MKQLNYEKEHRKLWNWLADHLRNVPEYGLKEGYCIIGW